MDTQIRDKILELFGNQVLEGADPRADPYFTTVQGGRHAAPLSQFENASFAKFLVSQVKADLIEQEERRQEELKRKAEEDPETD